MDAYVFLIIALIFGVGLCIGFVLGRVTTPVDEPVPTVASTLAPEPAPMTMGEMYFAGRKLPAKPAAPDFEHDPFFAHDHDDPEIERQRGVMPMPVARPMMKA